MPAPLRTRLTPEEDQTLHELSTANGVPPRVKRRAIALRLNATGLTVPEIAKHLKQSEHTVRNTIRRWQTHGLGGLWEALGRGLKPRWSEADIRAVEQWLQQERSYTSPQLCERLERERGIQLGARRLQRILQKRGGCGDAYDTVPHQQNNKHTNRQSVPIC